MFTIKNLFFYLVISIFLLGFFYSIFKFINSGYVNFYYLTFTILFFCIVLFLIVIDKFFYKFIKYILLIIYSIIFSFYLFEFFLIHNLNAIKNKNHIPFNILAERQNLSWDHRSSFEFYLSSKEKYENFFPNYFPYQLLKKGKFEGINIDGENIIPFGTISNSKTFLGNELGFYPIVNTDKYGFKNFDNDYSSKVDFILIGDSYIEGCCTDQQHSIYGNLKNKGFNVLSFGRNGAGPLTEYAIIREYLDNNLINYSNLIWFYDENDFENLALELNSEILKNYYLNDNFNQNLIEKQELIDKALINHLNEEIKIKINIEKNNKEFLNTNKESFTNFDMFNFLKLTNTRNLFYLMPKNDNHNYFKTIIYKSKKIVEKNNANFFFVYIPSAKTFTHNYNYQFKKPVLKTIRNLNIKILDLTDIILSLDEPTSILPFKCCGHFTQEGYSLISSYIIDELSKIMK